MAEAKPALLPADKARIRAEYERDWRKELRRGFSAKARAAIPRQPMPERGAAARSRDFGEVNLGLSPAAAVEEARRCLDCAVPGCVAGCPVAIDIPTFVKLIERRDFVGAARSIKQRVYALDGDTTVIPGHGPATLVGDEARSNPFVRAS